MSSKEEILASIRKNTKNRYEYPDWQIKTTELRIFALMRLGVTSSQEIATLLFYSTQTIYNYKSGMKARAKLRDTFEADVYRLCHVIDAPHGM